MSFLCVCVLSLLTAVPPGYGFALRIQLTEVNRGLKILNGKLWQIHEFQSVYSSQERDEI